MKIRLALVILILAASHAQASKVKICAHMANQAGETQEARKAMEDAGILYTAKSFFSAREEHYKRTLDKLTEEKRAEAEKSLGMARAMDEFIAGEVFKYPSVMPPTFAADQVQAACMRLSDQELVDMLKRK